MQNKHIGMSVTVLGSLAALSACTPGGSVSVHPKTSYVAVCSDSSGKRISVKQCPKDAIPNADVRLPHWVIVKGSDGVARVGQAIRHPRPVTDARGADTVSRLNDSVFVARK